MRNILIPTDFSENSVNAIAFALSFFESVAVNFYLLHVSLVEKINDEECFYKLSDKDLDKKTTYNPSEDLKAEIERIKKLTRSKNHNFYGLHESKQLIDAIRASVKEYEIDLIVMGTKGDSNASKKVLGRHTADVITKVKCAVLVIPENAKYRKPKNVVFPTDFNILYRNKVMETLLDVLKIKKASLSVLYISKHLQDLSTLQKKNRSYLQDYLVDQPHNFYFVTNKNINNAIETFVDTTRVDMIAMIAKNLNFFQRILFKPTIETISYQTNVPFLVLHE
jgi:nucleotide-binding universal stress UspA family protein